MNRVKRFIITHRFVFAAFFLPFLILGTAFAVMRIFPFGPNQITVIDMYHQYVPFLNELQYKLHHGGSLFFSWDGAGGFDFWTMLAYYGASPLNLLLVLFPASLIVEGVTLILMIKVGLAGSFMYMYLKRVYPVTAMRGTGGKSADCWSKVAFAAMYALSAYVLAYFWCIMWMDAVALLPLCILGLRKLVEGDSPVLYTVCLALIIFTNYYIAIMVCLFIVLYYFVIWFEKPREGGLPAFLVTSVRAALHSVIAAAMAGVMFYPTYRSMQHAYYFMDEMPEEWSFYNDPLEVFNQLLPNAHLSYREGLPNIYCGLFVVMMLVCYFISRTIPLRRKVVNGLFLALMFFSLNVNKLDFIWHGLHFPNQLPHRFSFAICFVLVGLGYHAFTRISEIRLNSIWAIFAGGLGYYLIAARVLGESEGALDDKDQFFYLGAAMLGVYVLLLVLMKKKILEYRVIAGILVFVVALELLCSSAVAFEKVGNVEREPYLSDSEHIAALLKKEDEGFERTELYQWGIMNCPPLYNYKGWSQFSSSLNADATRLMEQIGLEGEPGKNRYNYVYSSPVVNAMLNVGYIISTEEFLEDPHFIRRAHEENCVLYKNRYPLSVGYMLPFSINTWQTWAVDPFEVQDDYIRAATDNEVPGVFIPAGEPQPDSADLDVTSEGGGILETSGGEGKAGLVDLSYTADAAGSYYIYIEADQAETIQVLHEDGSITTLREDCGAVVYIGEKEEGETFTVEITYQQDGQGNIRSHVCRLDEEAWEKAYALISRDQLQVTDYGDTYLRGKIHVSEEGMFTTSVLFEEGWRLYVDGVKRDIEDFVGDDFIAVPLSAGDHEIELRYLPDGLIQGAALTVAGILALIALVQLRQRRIRVRRTREMSESGI